MKPLVIFIFLAAFSINSASGQTTNRTFKFTMTTIKFPGNYDPRHCLAVWIEDASGKYVNSLAVYANRRIAHLTNWNGVTRGVKGDAITGATLNPHRSHVLNWNLKDFSGNTVKDGTYRLRIEGTARNSAGSIKTINFVVGNETYTNKPADDANLKNMILEFTTPINTPIDETTSNATEFNVFPNPNTGNFSLHTNLMQPGLYTVSLVDAKGSEAQKLYSGYITAGDQNMELHTENSVKKGVYFLVVSNNHISWTSKIMIK